MAVSFLIQPYVSTWSGFVSSYVLERLRDNGIRK